MKIGKPYWWLSSKESACSAGDSGSILGWEDLLEEDMATHYSILAWRTPCGQRSPVGYSPWGHKKSDTTEQTKHNMDLVKNFPSLMWNIHFFSLQCFLLIFTRTSVTQDIF